MSGEEYFAVLFQDLLDRIHKAMGWDESVMGMSWTPDGKKQLLRLND